MEHNALLHLCAEHEALPEGTVAFRKLSNQTAAAQYVYTVVAHCSIVYIIVGLFLCSSLGTPSSAFPMR